VLICFPQHSKNFYIETRKMVAQKK